MSRCIQLALVLSVAACEYVGEAPTTPRIEPSPSSEPTSISTTDTAHQEPSPAKPKPAATHVVKPTPAPAPEPVMERMTRAAPKWKRPMTRGGVNWQQSEEKPRVVREPTEPQ